MDENGGSEEKGVFKIFDIYTAEKVGEISTGWWWNQPAFEIEDEDLIGPTSDDNKIFCGQWCTYIDDEGNCKILGQFNHDSDEQVEHYFAEMKWDTEKSFCSSEIAYKYLHEFHEELRCYDDVMFVIDVDYGFYFYEGNNQVRDFDEKSFKVF